MHGLLILLINIKSKINMSHLIFQCLNQVTFCIVLTYVVIMMDIQYYFDWQIVLVRKQFCQTEQNMQDHR